MRSQCRITALLLIVVLLIGSSLTLSSCRPKSPAGDDGASDPGTNQPGDTTPGDGTAVVTEGPAPFGFAGMPAAKILTGADGRKTIAVGPFTDSLVEIGIVPGTELAWGLGSLASGEQVYFTVDPGGAITAIGLSADNQVTVTAPLRGAQQDSAGLVSINYSDFTAHVYTVGGQDKALGSANYAKVSPGERRVLVFGRGDTGTTCWNVADWTSTPQPNIPAGEFPYAGVGPDWVTDDLVSVRLAGPNVTSAGMPDTESLELVKMPGGEVLGRLVTPGDILSPIPSPNGRYLAVLHISSASAVYTGDAIYPADYGQSLDIYEVSSLLGAANLADVKPVTTFVTPEGGCLTGVSWTQDSSKLVYSWQNCPVDTEGLVDGPNPAASIPVPDRRSKVWVAAAPSFESADAGLPEGYWTPYAVSPDGTHVVVGNNAGLGGYIWDIAAKQGAALPEIAGPGALSPEYLTWVDNDYLAGSSEPGYEKGQPVFVRASDGQVASEGIPTSPYYYSSGQAIVVRTALEADGPLGPFPELPAGVWMVLTPVPGE